MVKNVLNKRDLAIEIVTLMLQLLQTKKQKYV